MQSSKSSSEKAYIFDIKRDCSEDGPGIRTTVFFKGCPLSCDWCQNPEGKADSVKIAFHKEKCRPELCGLACVSICAEHCFSFTKSLSIQFDQCTRCDKCFDVCPTQALEPVGYWISLQDLLYRVLQDKEIFITSGGGVTLSGGEATQQMQFAGLFLSELKKQGIHTAIETSGFFNYRRFEEQMLPFLDLIYFDLKLFDEQDSIKFTGQSNGLIIENFLKLQSQKDVVLIPRIPLIPGITATQKNLGQIAQFLHQHDVHNAILLPYNPLWLDKIDQMGFEPKYVRREFMSQEEQEACIRFFKEPQLSA